MFVLLFLLYTYRNLAHNHIFLISSYLLVTQNMQYKGFCSPNYNVTPTMILSHNKPNQWGHFFLVSAFSHSALSVDSAHSAQVVKRNALRWMGWKWNGHRHVETFQMKFNPIKNVYWLNSGKIYSLFWIWQMAKYNITVKNANKNLKFLRCYATTHHVTQFSAFSATFVGWHLGWMRWMGWMRWLKKCQWAESAEWAECAE